MLIDFKDDAGLVGENDGDGAALQQRAQLSLHAAELFFMPRMLGGVLNTDKQTATRQCDGMKLKLFEQTIRCGEGHGAGELTTPDALSPGECDLLTMFVGGARVGEPAFDGLIFFERTPEQLGEAFVLEHGSTTLIENENATGNAFKISAQACFTFAKRVLSLGKSAQFLSGARKFVLHALQNTIIRWRGDRDRSRCRNRRWHLKCHARHSFSRNLGRKSHEHELRWGVIGTFVRQSGDEPARRRGAVRRGV